MPANATNRHVFFICGYDWKDWQYYASLFQRELDRHCAVTGAKAELGKPEKSADGVSVTWRARVTRGEGAVVKTVYEFLLWDHVIEPIRKTPLPKKLFLMLVALLDNVVTGTLFKMAAMNWRFALYWLYPIVMLTGLVALGAVVGSLSFDIIAGAGINDWVAATAGIGAGIAVFYGLLAVAEMRGALILMLLDALIFNLFHVRRKVPEMNTRIEQWGRRVAKATRDPALDEVMVVGHSWGTVHAVEIGAGLARDHQPAGQAGPAVSVMTIGATTPAIARHPSAGWLRRSVGDLARSPHILWIEYQAKKDFINFPDIDIVAGSGVTLPISERHATCFAHVRFRELLNAEFYNTIHKNLFRLHFQFLMANDFAGLDYDFFDIVTGTRTLWQRNRSHITRSQ